MSISILVILMMIPMRTWPFQAEIAKKLLVAKTCFFAQKELMACTESLISSALGLQIQFFLYDLASYRWLNGLDPLMNNSTTKNKILRPCVAAMWIDQRTHPG